MRHWRSIIMVCILIGEWVLLYNTKIADFYFNRGTDYVN